MRLHEDPKLFEQAIRATADKKDLLDIYVEKDYWVTLALFQIFQNQIGEETIFKGGTALSKCWELIDRFSEDIDLVVLQRGEETGGQLKNKIKTIGTVVSEVLPEIQVEGLTRKRGMNRKTAHAYKKIFKRDFGQVRDFIVVEASWLGSHEPYVQTKISSYIYGMLEQSGDSDTIVKYGLAPFTIQVLAKERTVCEKIMSLVRFSYGIEPIEDLKKKVRHTYDIFQLLSDEELYKFFESEKFDQMLLKVAQDDSESYKNNNKWLANHPSESLFFSDLDKVWKSLVSTYENDFSKLVFGELPDSNEVLDSMKMVKKKLDNIKWKIKL
ncbi:MAG: nucleotidyl transferase AbiEii/AbiGii toxin family protein [Crocinitomicaceae bacterium]